MVAMDLVKDTKIVHTKPDADFASCPTLWRLLSKRPTPPKPLDHQELREIDFGQFFHEAIGKETFA